MTFEQMFDGLDEMRALCIDLGYDLNDVVYDSVTVRGNVVTLWTYVRDESGDVIVDGPPGDRYLRQQRHVRLLPQEDLRKIRQQGDGT